MWQKNFAPVDEIGEAVQVVCSEGRFPVGIYIRNGMRLVVQFTQL